MREKIIEILKERGHDAIAEAKGSHGIVIRKEECTTIFTPDWWEDKKTPEEAVEIMMKVYGGV
jgi:hypothetical protein